MVLLTHRITNKSENSNLINAHAPSCEPVPLTWLFDTKAMRRCEKESKKRQKLAKNFVYSESLGKFWPH